MKRKVTLGVAMLTAIAIIAAGLAWANGTSQITRYVIGGGGGQSTGGDYSLYATIGQPVAGQSGELCSGFWCGVAVEYKIYLPLVLRNA